MRAINYKELRRMYEGLGAGLTVTRLSEALQEKHLRPEDFSLREMADTFLTEAFVKSRLDPRAGAGFVPLTEGGFDGVDVTAFSHITGRIVSAKMLEAYQSPVFVHSQLVATVPTRFNGERIPGVGKIDKAAAKVQPGMPFPNAGFGEDYIDTPATDKYGVIVPVTKEAVFFDQTGLVLREASRIGEVLAVAKEKRVLEAVWGIGSGNTWKWKGTTRDTYSVDGTTAGYGGTVNGFINQITDELVDWTDVDAAEQAFVGLTDPVTGDPIVLTARHLLTMPAYHNAALRVLSATEIRHGANADTTQTFFANPYAGRYQVATSALAYARILAVGNAGGAESAATAKKWWLLGDLSKAFAYMENWPLTVVQAPNNSEAEFQQDVVLRYKASERGVPAVLDPRYVVRSNPTHA